jgi:hypothetical protein
VIEGRRPAKIGRFRLFFGKCPRLGGSCRAFAFETAGDGFSVHIGRGFWNIVSKVDRILKLRHGVLGAGGTVSWSKTSYPTNTGTTEFRP